jgi:hypothetical protein
LKGNDMSMFFTTDPDPTEMASLLVGAALDCVPTGHAGLDVFIGEVADRYRAQGGFAAFEGDAVLMCEDVEVALQMIAAQATCENAREIAQMNLLALAEARESESWSGVGAESGEIDWATDDEYASSYYS